MFFNCLIYHKRVNSFNTVFKISKYRNRGRNMQKERQTINREVTFSLYNSISLSSLFLFFLLGGFLLLFSFPLLVYRHKKWAETGRELASQTDKCSNRQSDKHLNCLICKCDEQPFAACAERGVEPDQNCQSLRGMWRDRKLTSDCAVLLCQVRTFFC